MNTKINPTEGNFRSINIFYTSNCLKSTFYGLTNDFQRVQIPAYSEIPQKLGWEITEQGYIMVEMFQKTTIDGVFTCGDNSVMMRSVANVVYSGNITGAVFNGFPSQEIFKSIVCKIHKLKICT